MSLKLQSNLDGCMRVKTKLFKRLQNAHMSGVEMRMNAGFEPGYSVGMLGRCSIQSGKGFDIRTELELNKVNVPVSRRDRGGIEVGRSAWDGAGGFDTGQRSQCH
eukprot:1161439-Pelagomonas_calceolata.AAC.2